MSVGPWFCALLLLGAAGCGPDAAPPPPVATPRATVLLVGTFHFADPGLDSYQPRYRIDVLSPRRQREIAEVVDRLAAFRPTKVAVEWDASRQPALDSAYTRYRTRAVDSVADERYQVGFRLADRLGHARVYAIDAPARWYDSTITVDSLVAAAEGGGQAELIERGTAWDEYYNGLYEVQDSLKTIRSIRDQLLAGNAPAALRRSLGRYLVGEIEVGGGGAYPGADMRSVWYNRNIRVFSNIIRLASPPDDRILVLIGGGHVPILAHLFENSPEYDLASASRFLR